MKHAFFSTSKDILLIKPSSLGDVVHALPLLEVLKKAWPQSNISWVVAPAWQPLLQENPYLDRCISFDRESFRGVGGLVRAGVWFWKISQESWHPHLAIDLQGLLRSALIGKFFQPRLLVGLSDAREGAGFFYNTVASISKKDHAVDRYLGVLRLLGLPFPKQPRFWLPAGNLPVDFSLEQPYFVLHPYARGEAKSLPLEAIQGLVEGISPHRLIIVGKGNLDLSKVLQASNVEDWSNRTTLLELIAILRHAQGTISSDSGPLHLASAVAPEKVVAIHRWSDPLRVGPYGSAALVWKSGSLVEVSSLNERHRLPGTTPTKQEMKALALELIERWKISPIRT